MLSLSIHPLFVFDGPNKPPFKRNKRTGQNFASVPDFLAKQLLQQFGFPYHRAPGEAEAECALLQQKGIVDAVLSEDVDTLMFGSGTTLRNWSPELKSNGTPTHVNVFEAHKIKAGPSELDPKSMILIGMMSGGDYTPQGIPGCGPKVACEAARAGFGTELCEIDRRDKDAIRAWRDKLAHELRTNEGKHFRQRHKTLDIPEDFPSLEVLGYYTHPAVSDDAAVKKLKDSIKWDQDIDLPALRAFTAEAFDWTKLQGAKHFIRNLAPAILKKQLRLKAEHARSYAGGLEAAQEQESKLVQKIYSKREHASTDNYVELRLGFMPLELVPLKLEDEEPDDECRPLAEEVDEEGPNLEDDIENERPEGASKKRTPTNYDPSKLDRVWVLDTFVKAGVPLMTEDWEEGVRAAERLKQAKASKALASGSSHQIRSPKRKKSGGIPLGAIHQYAKVTKPNHNPIKSSTRPKSTCVEEVDLSGVPLPSLSSLDRLRPNISERTPSWLHEPAVQAIDLCSSPVTQDKGHYRILPALPQLKLNPSQTTLNSSSISTGRRKRSPLRRSISTPVSMGTGSICASAFPQMISSELIKSAAEREDDLGDALQLPSSPPGPEQDASQANTRRQETILQSKDFPDLVELPTYPRTPSRRAAGKNASHVILISSPSSHSPRKQRNIQEFFPSSQPTDGLQEADRNSSCEFRMPSESRHSQSGSEGSNQRAILQETPGNSRSRREQHPQEAIDQLRKDSCSVEHKPARSRSGKRTLELHESLDGTWKISKSDRLEVQSKECQEPSGSRVASKSRLLGVGKRSWRLSEVEVLDLT